MVATQEASYSHLSVSAGDWFQESPQIPISKDTQFPYIKRFGTVNRSSLLYLQLQLNPVAMDGKLYFKASVLQRKVKCITFFTTTIMIEKIIHRTLRPQIIMSDTKFSIPHMRKFKHYLLKQLKSLE